MVLPSAARTLGAAYSRSSGQLAGWTRTPGRKRQIFLLQLGLRATLSHCPARNNPDGKFPNTTRFSLTEILPGRGGISCFGRKAAICFASKAALFGEILRG